MALRSEYFRATIASLILFYSSRFVALKRNDGELKWVSEKLTFHGPKRNTVDGQLDNEAIALMCEIEQVNYHGSNIAGTLITYGGLDKRLARTRDHAKVCPSPR